MDIDTLKIKILAAKLHPIHISSGDSEGKTRHRFLGSLDQFLEAVSALSSKVVVIRTISLDEQDFFHEAKDEDDPSQFENDEDLVDLRKVEPKLRAFSKYLDKTGMYILSSGLDDNSLLFAILEEWWVEFQELSRVTAEKVDDEYDASLEKSRVELEARQSSTLSALDALIHDPKFAKQQTQIRMTAYALDKIPGLEDVDEAVVKVVIQRLHAKIKARES